MDEVIQSYADLSLHRDVSELIKNHSSNKGDVRSLLRSLLDWDKVATILDLGCGYGWLEEGLQGAFEYICGIDCLEENRDAFLATAARICKRILFRHLRLPASLEEPSDSHDLIVSAYSLYFFPEMIGEVKRLLKPGGTFLVITHSESMMEEGERHFDFRNLRRVIHRFSAENGEDLLRPFFKKVHHTDYLNTLVFSEGDGEDLGKYIMFKKEFISRDADPVLVRETMLKELAAKKTVSFNKNDRIFMAAK